LSYILKVGLMFGDKQYEEGDVVEDIPAKSVKWLKKQGLIEEVKGLEQAEALQKKRARNSKGHFIADDPTTEKNEAYEEQE
jgi:uncharacterized protein YdaT